MLTQLSLGLTKRHEQVPGVWNKGFAQWQWASPLTPRCQLRATTLGSSGPAV